jgi:phosphoglucomutase
MTGDLRLISVSPAAVCPTFGFMTLDWDGEIRMDTSSPRAMTTRGSDPAW